MNTFIQSVKKIVHSALFWAISVHLFIFFIVNYSMSNHETVSSEQGSVYKMEIPIQMSKSTGVKVITKNNSPVKASAPVNATIGTKVNENEVGNDSGNASGISFEETILTYQEPVYPLIAIKTLTEGKVKVRIKINPDGLPTESVILESSHHKLLDEAALKSIPSWRFKKRAASQDYFVEKTFVFKLNP